MDKNAGSFLLQSLKDRVIESGADVWARPMWMWVTRKQMSAYDSELSVLLSRVLKRGSTCIDVGAHKGLILDMCIRSAPEGRFYAFEPIPYLARLLRKKYAGKPNVQILELALSDKSGHADFYINKRAMGFSSLAAPEHSDPTEGGSDVCSVTLARMDDVLTDVSADFIKIDVEGAEFGVLRGGARLLEKSRPYIAFEYTVDCSEKFNTKPDEVYDFLSALGLQVSLVRRYIDGASSLSRDEFCDEFHSGRNFFFLAYPRNRRV
jgi:FkbM family methyltransferase